MQVKVRSAFKVSDALTIIHRRTTDNTMNLLPFGKKEFRKVAAVLTGNTGD